MINGYFIFIWVIVIAICFIFVIRTRTRRNNRQPPAQRIEVRLIDVRSEIVELEIVEPIEDIDCCICLDNLIDLESHQRVIKTTCDHYYHRICIKNWITSRNDLSLNCPLCLAHL